jgi:hypothetical protein
MLADQRRPEQAMTSDVLFGCHAHIQSPSLTYTVDIQLVSTCNRPAEGGTRLQLDILLPSKPNLQSRILVQSSNLSPLC